MRKPVRLPNRSTPLWRIAGLASLGVLALLGIKLSSPSKWLPNDSADPERPGQKPPHPEKALPTNGPHIGKEFIVVFDGASTEIEQLREIPPAARDHEAMLARWQILGTSWIQRKTALHGAPQEVVDRERSCFLKSNSEELASLKDYFQQDPLAQFEMPSGDARNHENTHPTSNDGAKNGERHQIIAEINEVLRDRAKLESALKSMGPAEQSSALNNWNRQQAARLRHLGSVARQFRLPKVEALISTGELTPLSQGANP